MTELQVERIDWHLVTNRQHSHGGEVAGRVSYICTSCHTGQTEGGAWKTETRCANGVGEKHIRLNQPRQVNVFAVISPENGPRPCCKFPRIFWPNKWINLVTTWTKTVRIFTISLEHNTSATDYKVSLMASLTCGYRLLMLLSVPSGSLTSSVSLTAWTVVALGCRVKAST